MFTNTRKANFSIRRHSSGRRDPRRGSALVTSVVVVMLAAAMGTAMLQMQAGVSTRQRLATDQKRALYIAEAGLSEGFAAIAQGKSGNVGSSSNPASFGDGVFWVEAKDQPDGKVALVSNGLCGSGRFSAAVLLEKQVNAVAQLGIFGDQQFTVNPSAVIDGYDSTAGSYAVQAHSTPVGLSTGAGARVTANCDIAVNGPSILSLGATATTIFGDAHPGPAKAVIATLNTNITGSKTPSPKSLPLPAVDLPTQTSSGTLDHSSPTPVTITGKQITYDSVRVRRGAKLILKGPAILVAGSFQMDGACEVQIDTSGGAVALYVTDYMNCLANSQLTNVGSDPKQAAILVSAYKTVDRNGDGIPDPPVTLASTGNFYGTFYAPSAAVTWPATLRGYGSVGAQKLTLASTARFSFDKALLTAASVLSGLPNFVSWKIVELPKVPIVASRQDPLTQLRAAAVTPVKADQAHLEQNISITYITPLGVVRTYSGNASLLDWTQVVRVLRKVWTP